MNETKEQTIARLEAELVLANNSEILRTQTDELLLKLNSSNVTVFELKAELAASREANRKLVECAVRHEDALSATRAECYERAAKRCCTWCAMGLDRIGVYHVAWKDTGQHLCQALDLDSLITPSDAAAREDWIRRIRLEEAEWWNKQFCSDEFDADLDLVIKRLESLRASVPAARVGDDPSADVGLIGNPAVCPMCGGIGTYPNSYSIHNREECPSCHGTGKRESK